MSYIQKNIIIAILFSFSMLVFNTSCSKDTIGTAVRIDNWWASPDLCLKGRPDLIVKYSEARIYENCREIDGQIVVIVSKEEWIRNGWKEDQ